MQRYDIGILQDIFEIVSALIRITLRAGALRNHDRHTELPRHVRNSGTQDTEAYDSNRHRGEFPNRKFEHAKVVCLLPCAGTHKSIVLTDTVREIQQYREYMFDDRLRAIGPDITNGNLVFFRSLEIDIVYAGCGQSYEPQATSVRYDLMRHTGLVGKNEIDAVDSFWHEFRWGAVECVRICGSPVLPV